MCVTRLETLPNELLAKIFSYLTPAELLVSVESLNVRIDAIIRIIPMSIDFDPDDHNEFGLLVLSYYAEQVATLRIVDEISGIDLSIFSNLCVLDLGPNLWTVDLKNQISRGTLPKLKHLIVDGPVELDVYGKYKFDPVKVLET